MGGNSMSKIICPNKQYTGISASVAFANGIGETERPELIKWFKEHGYEVEEIKEVKTVEPNSGENTSTNEENNNAGSSPEGDSTENDSPEGNSSESDSPEGDSSKGNSAEIELNKMTVDELKAYAKEKGIDIGNSTSQKGILKKILEAKTE
jgi:DNA-binding transcriptional MerR regulator